MAETVLQLYFSPQPVVWSKDIVTMTLDILPLEEQTQISWSGSYVSLQQCARENNRVLNSTDKNNHHKIFELLL